MRIRSSACSALGLWAALLTLSVATQVAQGVSFQNENEFNVNPHRLPSNVRPVSYKINLDLTSAFDEAADGEQATYTGTTSIQVEFSEGRQKSPLKLVADLRRLFCYGNEAKTEEDKCASEGEKNTIVMHADKSVEILDVEVLDAKGRPMTIRDTGRSSSSQMVFLKMERKLPRDGRMGEIRISFRAPVRRAEQHGVYLSRDTTDGQVKRHVVAKFQPTFARLAMPCFDEPGFKASFELAFKHQSKYVAYANMEESSRQAQVEESSSVLTSFKQSPAMSVHMVAFIVGEFAANPQQVEVRPGLNVRFLSVDRLAQSGQYALDVAKRALLKFEEYIDRPFPLSKLDIVAISETDLDNTETWGLVFVRDRLVAIDDESQPATRVTTAVNVAHVVVHQWFANLVTARWWDDLWITESVASERAFAIVESLFPVERESEQLVRLSVLTNELTRDSSGKWHSMSPPEDELSTSAEIYNIFDVLTFMKSGAVARMLDHTLGKNLVRNSLRLLVKKFAFKNFVYDDFIQCIKQASGSEKLPGIAYQRVLRNFSKLSGFPLVNVEVGDYFAEKDRHLLAYLEPFHKAKSDIDTTQLTEDQYLQSFPSDPWYMPLETLISDFSGQQRTVKPLEFGAFTIRQAELPDWFTATNHFVKLQPKPDISTWYRVRYSDRLMSQLQKAISQDQLLDPMDRLHLLDDADALVKSNLIPVETFRQILDSYANEEHFGVIIAMLVAARTSASLQPAPSTPSASSKVFLKVFEQYKFETTGQETLLEQRARSAVLKALVAQETGQKQSVTDAALDKFDGGQVELFLREPVYAAVVKAGGEDRVGKLVERMSETKSYEEKVRLTSALALSKDTKILQKLVDYLNERSGFKSDVMQTIVQSSTSLALKDGRVVLA